MQIGFSLIVARRITALAAPMMLSRAGLLIMVAVDTAMIGHAGIEPLAYYGLANAIHIPTLVVMIGLLTSVVILSSQAIGAGRPGETARIWLVGSGVAVTTGFAAGLVLWFGQPILSLLGQSEDLAVGAAEVMQAFAPGMPAIGLYIACVFLLESLGKPRVGLVIVILGNLVNFASNLILMDIASPAIGASIGMTIARWVMALAAFLYVFRLTRTEALAIRGTAAEYRSVFIRILRKGTPVAIAQYLETASFNGTVIFAGWISANAVATMQISFNVLALVFMLSLGIGTAASVEVGRATGAGDLAAVRRSGWTALALNVGIMTMLMPVLYFNAGAIAGLYTDDPGLMPLATTAVAITALVLVVDGGQAVTTGALRGFGDVMFGTGAYLIAFGVCALPLAWWLGVHQGLGTPGLLYGIIAGLVLLLIMLLTRFHLITRDRDAILS